MENPFKTFVEAGALVANSPDKIRIQLSNTLECKRTQFGDCVGSARINCERKNNEWNIHVFISPMDCAFFKKFNAFTIEVYNVADEEGIGHRVFMERNARTGDCEVYDPNGTLFDFDSRFGPPEMIKSVIRDVHLGLLAPLLGSDEYLCRNNISFQTALDGLQSLEVNGRSVKGMLTSEFESVYSLQRHYAELFEDQLNCAPGFCNVWSHIRLFDKILNDGVIYAKLEQRALNDKLDDIVACARGLGIQDKFYNQILQNTSLAGSNGKDIEQKDRIFKRLFLSIFIRMVVSHFYAHITIDHDAVSDENDLDAFNAWPIIDTSKERTDKDMFTEMLKALMPPEGKPLWTSEDLARIPGMRIYYQPKDGDGTREIDKTRTFIDVTAHRHYLQPKNPMYAVWKFSIDPVFKAGNKRFRPETTAG